MSKSLEEQRAQQKRFKALQPGRRAKVSTPKVGPREELASTKGDLSATKAEKGKLQEKVDSLNIQVSELVQALDLSSEKVTKWKTLSGEYKKAGKDLYTLVKADHPEAKELKAWDLIKGESDER
jgi:peptidoglycan hydrolase CwlO-like protein